MAEPDTLTPAPPVTVIEAARQVAARQAAELTRWQKAARKGKDPEAVHQMRVATRRLRAALRALQGHVAARRSLRRRLRWLAGRLGAVRDHDVILALLGSRRLPAAAEAERARLDVLVARLDARRRAAQSKLAAALKRKRYSRLLDDLEAFVKRPRGIGGEEPLAARVLADVGERLGETIVSSPAMTQAMPSPEELHALRIDCKRLRYALEFHAAACGFSYDAERRLAREMQDVLGDIHDRDLLAQWLEEGAGMFRGPWPALMTRLAAERSRLFRRFLRQRRAWKAHIAPSPLLAPLEEPRWVHLEPQPVTLRLVSGGRSVAATMVG